MSEESEINELSKNSNDQTLSSRLQSLLEKPELLDKMLKSKPSWFASLDDETPSSVIAGNLIASALSGDKRAIELIQKVAYGDKVVIDTTDSFFNREKLTIEIVDPKHKEDINEDS